jgi:hypothetical protein
MNAKQALEIIHQATAQTLLTRQAHEQVLQALSVLKGFVDNEVKQDTKVAPVEVVEQT